MQCNNFFNSMKSQVEKKKIKLSCIESLFDKLFNGIRRWLGKKYVYSRKYTVNVCWKIVYNAKPEPVVFTETKYQER